MHKGQVSFILFYTVCVSGDSIWDHCARGRKHVFMRLSIDVFAEASIHMYACWLFWIDRTKPSVKTASLHTHRRSIKPAVVSLSLPHCFFPSLALSTAEPLSVHWKFLQVDGWVLWSLICQQSCPKENPNKTHKKAFTLLAGILIT